MTDFANDLQETRDAIASLEGVATRQAGNLPEIFAEILLSPELFAQVLMQHLPFEGMSFANKTFWLAVAEYIGPDYISAFRHVGGFMGKINEF